MQLLNSLRFRSRRLWREKVIRPLVVPSFARVWYGSGHTWRQTVWRGFPCRKCPFDLWVYQELIAETRPTLVLETGTFRGGSALYFADLLDVVADGGEVVTVDVTEEPERPDDPRITYISGSSVSPEVMTEMQTAAGRHERVMVVLDSDHSKEHVLAEMRVYADLVTPGCYLIVEDGLVNGHPVERRWGPGPYEAIQQFLAQDNRFEVDRAREKHYLTQNPSGYLRRRT